VSQSQSSGGADPAQGVERRTFLSSASGVAMAAGLAGGYGAFGALAVRYLYPASDPKKAWLFVADVSRLKRGDSLSYRAPAGEMVTVARQGDSGTLADFIALSSVCPHLGCQVHWEGHNDRFFCPCHNGTFDRSGKGTGGPPGDAGQSLSKYPLRLEGNLLFIEVPTEGLAPEEPSAATSTGNG
jgi:Rieske Fe-S protein